MCWWVFNHFPSIKVVCIQVLKIFALFIGIVQIFDVLIISTGITLHCLGNPASNTFFNHQQHIYIFKQLKPELIGAYFTVSALAMLTVLSGCL